MFHKSFWLCQKPLFLQYTQQKRLQLKLLQLSGNHKSHQTLTPLLGSVMQAYIPTVS